MEAWDILGDVVLLLAAAAMLGMLFERLGASGIIGCMVAGMLVGPGALGWITSDPHEIEHIAEIGVALLLFTIGLEISRAKLRAFGKRGLSAGLLQVVVTLAVVACIARLMGLGWTSALAVGAVVALSSTASVARMLTERSEVDSLHGRMSLSILIVQDVALVPLLLMVTFLGDTGDFQEVITELGEATGRIVVYTLALFLAGVLLIPRIFRSSAATGNRDLPVVLAVVTCLMATWISWRLGLSPALGAFVAGLVLADSSFARQIRSDVTTLKAVFLTLFFASIGMLADLPWLLTGWNLGMVLLASLGIILVKGIVAAGVVRLSGTTLPVSVAVGACLAQLGEFSFVLGAVARANGLLDTFTFQVLTSSSLITLMLVPLFVGRARWIVKVVDRLGGGDGSLANADMGTDLSDHVIVIGAGPAGRSVLRDMVEHGVSTVVIEANPATVQFVGQLGMHAILGNATRPGILHEASVETARAVVVTLPDPEASKMVIEQIRTSAPDCRVMVRCRYNVHGPRLVAAGADRVVYEEDSVGEAIGSMVVEELGLEPAPGDS
ncbi:MAG: cation:proton antiporter [Phycisphaerales bacterium]|nr:cation:proton antiporter [Phycisphaerales bacterium]